MSKNEFSNILFVMDASTESAAALKRAGTLSKANDARLVVYVIQPVFPDYLAFEATRFREHIESQIAAMDTQPAEVHYETEDPHFLYIIKHILKNGHDLLIKAAEIDGGARKKGFKSLDMNLLRKCPCPVLLCKKTETNAPLKVLSAVDASTETQTGMDLNKLILDIGETMREAFQAQHHVMSCWRLEHETFLRESVFSDVRDDELTSILREQEQEHKQDLRQLISEAGMDPEQAALSRKGDPVAVIPRYIEDTDTDIIVMGTVARTGIPGLIIGNTAENLIQEIACDMLAVKPPGFVSPVKAD